MTRVEAWLLEHMTVRKWCATVIVAIGATLVTSNAIRSRQERWEYGRLEIGGEGYVWSCPEVSITDRSWSSFYDRMGGTGQWEGDQLAIWNLLGKDGWQVVESSDNTSLLRRLK